jgi:hypothetical protein
VNAFIGSRLMARADEMCDSCKRFCKRVASIQVHSDGDPPQRLRMCVACARDVVFAARRIGRK